MAVLGLLSVTLEVPDIAPGVAFYTDAGLQATVVGDTARFRCPGQDRDCIVLKGGFARKRLHHVALRADGLSAIAEHVPGLGGTVIDAGDQADEAGLWVADRHGMLYHLLSCPADPAISASTPFAINAPGSTTRVRRSALRPSGSYEAAQPLRLGHVMLFSPDVPASVAFLTEALGMGLADRSEDVVAFCCARADSDHHVVAFAKSPGVGFHHASFEVRDPDEVGRAGEALRRRSAGGHWGFGRHTIGSNFFHYIQDPWGSWFEYFSDMDFIDDYALWSPTNYGLEDSLAHWGPDLPADFVHNYEAEPDAIPDARARHQPA